MSTPPTPPTPPPGAPLRVALVSEYYYPDVGGMPEHVHHLAGALCRRGHQVSIVTTRFPDVPGAPGGGPELPGVEVVRLGRACAPLITNGSVSRAAVGLRLGAEMAALLARRAFDVIHVHAPIFPTLALLGIRHAPAGSALVGTLHAHFEDSAVLRLFRRPLQRYLDALDGLIAVSESTLSSIRRVGLRGAAAIIPNGVDLDYWGRGRRLPEFGDGRLHLLVQARLEPRNDLPVLLQALGLLARTGPPVRLLVLGDGPMRPALLAALPAGPLLHCHFAGTRIADRCDFAATSDIYCFTARIASHPMSLLEGMAAGLPVVSHDIEGARGLVRDGVEGLLVPLSDPPALALALGRLLGDEGLRRRMGALGRKRAEAYGWDDIAARVEGLYREVLLYRLRRRRSDALCSV